MGQKEIKNDDSNKRSKTDQSQDSLTNSNMLKAKHKDSNDKIMSSLGKNFQKHTLNVVTEVKKQKQNNIDPRNDLTNLSDKNVPKINLSLEEVNNQNYTPKDEKLPKLLSQQDPKEEKLSDKKDEEKLFDVKALQELKANNNEKFKVKKEACVENNKENVKSKGGSLWQDIRKVYKFKELLSSGHFGTVRLATKRNEDNKKFFAIKSISKKNLTEQDLQDLMKEVEILSCLDHPNIIKFYETYQDQYYFHLVMELCTGKEVFDKISEDGYITEQRVSQIIYQVTSAICYCHSIGITHRDIKPENILFESSENYTDIKLIDFGLSRKYNMNEKMHTILGTPYYVAPEVLRGEYDHKCDVWSIGAICYIMLCGCPPFGGKNNNDIFQLILKSELQFDEKKWQNISAEAKDFIKQCLDKNPEKRFTAQMALQHNWFKDINKEVHSTVKLCKDILHNLKNFSVKGRFKKLVLKLFLVNFLTSTELKKLRESFQAIDLSNEGSVGVTEFQTAAIKAGMKITDEELKIIFKNSDNNGKINYTEFLIASMNEKSFIDKEKLLLAFKYFDVDENGLIDCIDLRSVLLRSGKEILHTEELHDIIEEVSQNKGKINLSEFLKMFEYQDDHI